MQNCFCHVCLSHSLSWACPDPVCSLLPAPGKTEFEQTRDLNKTLAVLTGVPLFQGNCWSFPLSPEHELLSWAICIQTHLITREGSRSVAVWSPPYHHHYHLWLCRMWALSMGPGWSPSFHIALEPSQWASLPQPSPLIHSFSLLLSPVGEGEGEKEQHLGPALWTSAKAGLQPYSSVSSELAAPMELWPQPTLTRRWAQSSLYSTAKVRGLHPLSPFLDHSLPSLHKSWELVSATGTCLLPSALEVLGLSWGSVRSQHMNNSTTWVASLIHASW